MVAILMVISERKGGGQKSGKGFFMNRTNVIEISNYRGTKKKSRKRDRLNEGKKGRVYSRNGKLWVDFRYLGERIRERSGFEDSTANRRTLRNQLDLIVAEIENGAFEFAERFPHSNKKDYFTMLEGRTVVRNPEEVLFGEYLEKWWNEMEPGMNFSQIKDYTTVLEKHHLPYFRDASFREICSKVGMKKYVAHLKSKKNRYGQPISAKTIQNVMIPLRIIVRDAIDEYDWTDLTDPFSRLKLPKVRKIRICPFSFEEWETVMKHMLPWYKPYFDFAVQTGLRPSEQVALKWKAIDEEYVHIELSRVRNREKSDLKTEESRRSIRIRPGMKDCLKEQVVLSERFDSPYVFINTEGRPILQDKLREVWARVLKKTEHSGTGACMKPGIRSHPGRWRPGKHRNGWLAPWGMLTLPWFTEPMAGISPISPGRMVPLLKGSIWQAANEKRRPI